MILEWKNNSSVSSSHLKKSWYEECIKWFSRAVAYKGNYATAGIVHNGVTPVFVVFSYEGKKGMIEPLLTAFVSENKVITDKFPWEALDELFMLILCVREFVKESLENMKIKETDCEIIAFYDTEPADLIKISA